MEDSNNTYTIFSKQCFPALHHQYEIMFFILSLPCVCAKKTKKPQKHPFIVRRKCVTKLTSKKKTNKTMTSTQGEASVKLVNLEQQFIMIIFSWLLVCLLT